MPSRDNPHGLNEQQLLFCRAFSRSLNATEAYLEVYGGSSDSKSTGVKASKLMALPKIRACLCELLELNEATVINELSKIAFASVTDVMTWDADGAHLIPSDEMSDRGKAAIKSIKVRTRTSSRTIDGVEVIEVITEAEITLHDKLSALDKLARKLRLYPKECSVLEAIATLAQQGLLLPGQASAVRDGLEDIEDGLRSLSLP
jgi:phage terminase small subunit